MTCRLSDEIARSLEAWLANVLRSGDVVVTELRPVAGAGSSAETSFFEASYRSGGRSHRQRLVLRRQIEGSDLFIEADFSLPWRVMRALALHTDVPVPGLIGLETDCSVLGSPFLVMEQSPGRTVSRSPNYNVQGWLTDLSLHDRGEVWRNALATMAQINRVDWRDTLSFLDKPELGETGLPQYLRGLEKWYAWACEGRPNPIIDRAMEYLREHRPETAFCELVWGDPTPSNIVFAEDLSVTAVLDWETVALGVAEIDLAWWLFMDEFYSTGIGVERLEGLPDRPTMIAHYESYLARPVSDLDYYEVLSQVRFAIVLVRATHRQIALGRILPDSRAHMWNPVTRMMARRLGYASPPNLDDYHAMSAAVTSARSLPRR